MIVQNVLIMGLAFDVLNQYLTVFHQMENPIVFPFTDGSNTGDNGYRWDYGFISSIVFYSLLLPIGKKDFAVTN